MTTLYRPVLIESAEQAEALPEGVVVIGTRVGVVDKGSRGRWWSGLTQVPAPTVIGGSALVPIEAEEEFSAENSWGGRDLTSTLDSAQADAEMHGTAAQTRYVTPWEEAPPAQD